MDINDILAVLMQGQGQQQTRGRMRQQGGRLQNYNGELPMQGSFLLEPLISRLKFKHIIDTIPAPKQTLPPDPTKFMEIF